VREFKVEGKCEFKTPILCGILNFVKPTIYISRSEQLKFEYNKEKNIKRN